MSSGPRKLTDLGEIAQHFRRSSSVVLHSAYAEPRFLAQELARIGTELDDVRVYTMMPMGGSPYAAPELDRHLVLRTFYPGKALRAAVNNGRAEVIRAPLSAIPDMFKRGTIKANVLMLQLSPPDENGRMSMGVSVDYMPAVLAQNPILVAEVNPFMPHTCGDTCISVEKVDYVVEAKAPPQSFLAGAADEVDNHIAKHIAELIGHGSVLQIGIGSISDLVLKHLTHLSNLGIHTGIITDAIVPLIKSGIVTNATKRAFAGKTVATMAGGTQAFYDFLDRNPLIEFHPCTVTHDAKTLAAIEGLCAINTVLQIDLTGRANAEAIDGRIISSVGGLSDFARGAAAANAGQSIIALRSTSRNGRTSNILAQFPDKTPVAIDAAAIDFVVTEYGIARIRGLSQEARSRALIEIAHPSHRSALRQQRVLEQP